MDRRGHQSVFRMLRAMTPRNYHPLIGDVAVGRTPEQFVAEINAMLAHSYNAAGVERWWQRPRFRLGGSCPGDVVADPTFDVAGAEAQVIRELALSLVGPGDAT